MKLVYRATEPAEAHQLRAELEALGLHAHVFGETLQAGVGDIPFFAAYPTVHVPDEQAEAANAVVADWIERSRSPAVESPPWTCPNCHETVDGVFTACWNCGAGTEETGRPAEPPADAS
ncbi:MAG: DUF2007 domain-containing protein [Planctomycetota bacterium]